MWAQERPTLAWQLEHHTERLYTYTLNTNTFGLNGSGTWSVTIQNAWTGSAVATYDLDIIFNGICEGDCFDPNACNFVPDAELVNNDLCLYAIDLYPNGLYDCDGNCYLDFDGDGICNALEFRLSRTMGVQLQPRCH